MSMMWIQMKLELKKQRHGLRILGNERTLTNSQCEWKELVRDARNRHCLFNADDDDERLKMPIIITKRELDHLDDRVYGLSIHEKWKVLFSDNFRRSLVKLTSPRLKKQVLDYLWKLSYGWQPKNNSVDVGCKKSSQILSKFKVEGLYIISSVDIIKEAKYIQVLKIWDILPLEEVPNLTEPLERIFSAYIVDHFNHCTLKCLKGNLEVPRSWPAYKKIVRFRYYLRIWKCKGDSEASASSGDGRNYVENSKVSESLLLMKFYSLSEGMVNHLLSSKEFDQTSEEKISHVIGTGDDSLAVDNQSNAKGKKIEQ